MRLFHTSPKPQQYSSPEAVMAAECDEPHATSRTRFERNVSMSFGLSNVILFPWPNFPSSPSPKHETLNSQN